MDHAAPERSVLCRLVRDVADILRAAEGTVWRDESRAAVVREDEGDLDELIAQAMGRTGLCATVMLRSLSGAARNMAGPVFRSAEIVVEVAERSPVNRPAGLGVSAVEAAEQAARALHQARTTSGRILLVEAVRRYPQPPEGCDGCWHVELSTGEVNLVPGRFTTHQTPTGNA